MSTKYESKIKQFGETIRKERERLGISQEKLAFKASLDRTYISGIERGARNPSLRNILKIADALEIEPTEFFKKQ